MTCSAHPDDIRERTLYVGDSPNDAPMFDYFPLGCGVANVLDFESSFAQLPAYIAPNGAAVDSFVSPMRF